MDDWTNCKYNIPQPPKETWWNKLMKRLTYLRFEYQVWCGYYTMKCEPLRCTKCDYWKLDCRVVDRIDYTPCEVEYVCPKCNNICGYWAYGHFEPLF